MYIIINEINGLCIQILNFIHLGYYDLYTWKSKYILQVILSNKLIVNNKLKQEI